MNQAQPTHFISFGSDINPTSTETLLALCGQLANSGAETLYLLLSTPGGSVMHGLTAYNVLRSLPARLITHNVGNVNSIGNVVFLAGTERYSCAHATFMFHGVGFDVQQGARFEEKLLRERLDGVAADQDRIGKIIVEHTSIDEAEAKALFLEAKTRDPEYALKKGIIHAIKDATVPRGAPFHQLVFKR